MISDERQNTLREISSIVSDVLQTPDLEMTEATTASEVTGWDSLTHIQIIIGIEQHYGIRFTSTEVAQLENAGSLVDLVVKYRQ